MRGVLSIIAFQKSMINRRYKAVGFDMDGTLVDTKIEYKRLFGKVAEAFKDAGIPEDVISNMSYTGPGAHKEGMDPDMTAKAEKIVADIALPMVYENQSHSELFPGTLEMLAALRSKGYKIGTLTNSFRERTEKVLEDTGLTNLLDAVACADDHAPSEAKPSPKAMEYFAEKLGVRPREILYLGDYNIDMMSARDAGAGFIGVLSGICSKEDWTNLGVNDTIGTVAELKDRI